MRTADACCTQTTWLVVCAALFVRLLPIRHVVGGFLRLVPLSALFPLLPACVRHDDDHHNQLAHGSRMFFFVAVFHWLGILSHSSGGVELQLGLRRGGQRQRCVISQFPAPRAISIRERDGEAQGAIAKASERARERGGPRETSNSESAPCRMVTMSQLQILIAVLLPLWITTDEKVAMLSFTLCTPRCGFAVVSIGPPVDQIKDEVFVNVAATWESC